MNLVVEKSDLDRIGTGRHSSGEYEDRMQTGFTNFVCSNVTAGIDYILLRNILSLYGYEITSESEIEWNNDFTEVVYTTNYPWAKYYEEHKH